VTPGATFRALHERGCFVMPNPWDVGSARVFAALGFRALATTSSGFAWTRGRRDNTVPLERVLDHLREMAHAVPVPVNADFEGGFAREPDRVAAHVAQAAHTGVAGLSIEDSTGSPDAPLYAFPLAVERVAAARAALDSSSADILLTARTEGFIVGRPDLRETIGRLEAFAEAGADCLYAPGLRAKSDIEAVVRAVAPKPVNVLVGTDFITVSELAALGVRRVSTGGALARTAWRAAIDAAREVATAGTFGALARAVPARELEQLLIDD